MRRWYVPILLLMLSASGCNWGTPHNTPPAITKDTLAFKQKTLIRRSKTDTVVFISYPEFYGKNTLDSIVVEKIINLLQVDAIVINEGLEKYADNFMKDYRQEKFKYPQKGDYSLHITAKVVRQDSSLTTIIIDGYEFFGGARGLSQTVFINWHTKSGCNLQLKDLVKKDRYNELAKLGDSIFRKQENLSDTTSLAKNYFFQDNKFALTDNFLITPVGLRFLYNEGDIKPVTANQTEIIIPYSKIRSLLRPNTVISQYIK